MDSQRQEAYRHLLYTALLHLRAGHREVVWWSLPSWRRAACERRQGKALADCFHNLSFFSVWNFQQFNEELFWQDVERFGRDHGAEFVGRYRRIFDDYISGHAARV